MVSYCNNMLMPDITIFASLFPIAELREKIPSVTSHVFSKNLSEV